MTSVGRPVQRQQRECVVCAPKLERPDPWCRTLLGPCPCGVTHYEFTPGGVVPMRHRRIGRREVHYEMANVGRGDP